MKKLAKEFSVFLVVVVGIPFLFVSLFPDLMDGQVLAIVTGGLAGLTVGIRKFF